MKTIEDAFELSRALVFGVGGCGDIVSITPTARFFEAYSIDVVLGGVA